MRVVGLLVAFALALAAPASASLPFYLGNPELTVAEPDAKPADVLAMTTPYIDGRPEASWTLLLDHGVYARLPRADVWIQADPLPMPPVSDETVIDLCTWRLELSTPLASYSYCSDAYAGTLMTGTPQLLSIVTDHIDPVHGRNMDTLKVTLSVTPAFAGTVSILFNSTDYPSAAFLTGIRIDEHGPAPADGQPREGAREGPTGVASPQLPTALPVTAEAAAPSSRTHGTAASDAEAPGVPASALVLALAGLVLLARRRKA